MTETRFVTLNNGVQIPSLGLGVLQNSPAHTAETVETALKIGYRLIDTAAAYFNEREVGEGLVRAEVDRSEVFLTTKVWITDYGYDSALRAFDVSLRKMGIEQLDLWLLHMPLPNDFAKTIATYKAAERLLADGCVRAIGVSNCTPTELDELIAQTSVVPAVNQIQVHPYYSQPDWRAANEKYGILTQSWSPIGGSYTRAAKSSSLEDSVIRGLADKYSKTPAQIVLRWHLDNGFCAIPKSANTSRIAENFDVFDFVLTPDDCSVVSALDTGVRVGVDPDVVTLERNGFAIPD